MMAKLINLTRASTLIIRDVENKVGEIDKIAQLAYWENAWSARYYYY